MANERRRGNDLGPSGAAVAANIARIRKSQQLSLAEVASRLASRGHKISVSGLSKIENRERRVDVDDLMALAYVLDVSPLGILLPHGQPDEVAKVTATRGAIALLWEWGIGVFSPQWSEPRAITARSLPPWLSVKPSIDLTPRRALLQLDFEEPVSGELDSVRWIHDFRAPQDEA